MFSQDRRVLLRTLSCGPYYIKHFNKNPMTSDLSFLFWMSVLTFAMFGLDKHLATINRQRIPEALLFVLIVLDGAFGALCGMMFFRHKTQHNSFLMFVPIMLAVEIALHILYHLFVL